MIKQLFLKNIESINSLTQLLNPTISKQEINARQEQMFAYPTYSCYGYYKENNLIALFSLWKTTRIYSGKQLEIDNFIVHPNYQSKGIGNTCLNFIENLAKDTNCLSVELNTYKENVRSHQFYERNGYCFAGKHYLKKK